MKCLSREVSEYVYVVTSNGETIIYAPILHSALRVSGSLKNKEQNVIVSQLSEISAGHLRKGKSNLLRTLKSPYEMTRMTILPNFKCNFMCSYCYAAKGRSNIEMTRSTLDVALDWFLNPNRVPYRELYVHIVGGGEPLMSWERVEETLKKVSEARNIRDQKIDVAMTTNGSLITDERAMLLASTNVFVNISFEVIKEVHNLQRGMYETVEKGIFKLQRAGARIAIHTTISPVNVDRMPDVVEIVLQRFPFVKRLSLEAIMAGKEVFNSAEALQLFLRKFQRGFSEAQRLGANVGMLVTSASHLKLDMLKERFCLGDFCLTPYGDIVICHRISSPNEFNYKSLVFGKVKDGRLEIDELGYQRALAFSVHDRLKCRQCFLRWNCGGLCVAKQMSFPPDYYGVLCDSAREEGFAFIKGIAETVA